jgi:hypothetical protein
MFKGSVVVSFVAGSDATNLAAAVKSISANPNAMSDLTARSINVNGNTYSTSASSSDLNNGSSA